MMKIITYVLAISLLWSCSTTKERTELIGTVQRPQIIYKTTQDFSNNVPIQMNSERTKITGFPAPLDLSVNGELQTPIALEKGYYYDRRGISTNTVFIKMTYLEYSKLKSAPAVKELMEMIIEKYPFSEMYSCSSLNGSSSLEDKNAIVKSGFKDCKKIK